MFSERGCLFNSLLFLVIVFVPIVGHIILTIMVLEDDHKPLTMIVWLLFIWLIPIIGPLCYLLFGQRRSHVYLGKSSYQPQQEHAYQYQQ